jgi:two-component system CheB/CheR fusion protein
MALVLIQHLDPKHESILTALLSRSTRMPVREVSNRMPVEPNHVYVIPRNTNMQILESTLHLTRRLDTGEKHMPVDSFFQSLAEAKKSNAIGVILSGTGSDGTAGLRAIKSEGGITFAQEMSSAKFDGMPRSAISAGMADYVLPPEEIARELAHISLHPFVTSDGAERTAEDEFNKIFSLLRAQTGSDFSSYKRGTIGRRVRRRMVLQKMETLPDYVKLLQTNPVEVKALYEDLLINVTEFFRDPKSFETLKTDVFPKLLQDREPDTPVRIWVPGCSTGEEVYSIAIFWPGRRPAIRYRYSAPTLARSPLAGPASDSIRRAW